MSSKLDEIYTSNSNFLKVADLNNQKVHVTIASAEIGEVGAEKKKQIVLTFKEGSGDKKFGLNKTNANMIAFLTGTDDYTNWIGTRITLKPSMTEYQGKPTPCIRVADELPPQHSGQYYDQQSQKDSFGGPVQPVPPVPQRGPEVDENKVPF